jgi:hypothetical protein
MVAQPRKGASLSLALLLMGIIAAGCSQSGDFGVFIVTEVAKYGGHTKTTAMIPKLDARWMVKRDDNGFQAFITDASFASVAADMERVFGTPKMSDDGSDTTTHEPDRVWSAVDTGVAIQLIGHKDCTEIICIRGVKNMDQLWGHAKP